MIVDSLIETYEVDNSGISVTIDSGIYSLKSETSGYVDIVYNGDVICLEPYKWLNFKKESGDTISLSLSSKRDTGAKGKVQLFSLVDEGGTQNQDTITPVDKTSSYVFKVENLIVETDQTKYLLYRNNTINNLRITGFGFTCNATGQGGTGVSNVNFVSFFSTQSLSIGSDPDSSDLLGEVINIDADSGMTDVTSSGDVECGYITTSPVSESFPKTRRVSVVVTYDGGGPSAFVSSNNGGSLQFPAVLLDSNSVFVVKIESTERNNSGTGSRIDAWLSCNPEA